jgi:hypothetical protein
LQPAASFDPQSSQCHPVLKDRGREPCLRRDHEWEKVRSAEGPNDLLILQDVADVAKARACFKAPRPPSGAFLF